MKNKQVKQMIRKVMNVHFLYPQYGVIEFLPKRYKSKCKIIKNDNSAFIWFGKFGYYLK